MIDAWHEDLRVTALQLETDVKREDLAKKAAMVNEAKNKFNEFFAALEETIKPNRLNVAKPDFALAIKGKSKYASMQSAIDDMMALAEMQSTALCKDVSAKLAWCKETSAGFGFLFSDMAAIISKPMDDFQLVVTSRIKDHKAAEAEKLEAEREVMRIEEERKATAKAQAEAEAILAAGRAKQAEEEAETRAKVEAESRAKAEHEAAELEKQNREYLSNLADTALKNGGFQSVSESAAIEERRKQAQLDAQARPFKLSGAKVVVAQAIAPRRPNRAELLDAVATTFGTTNEAALDWILQEFRGDIQHEERQAA